MAGTQMEFQPTKSNAALQAMSFLIGDWQTEISSIRADPTARIHGHASFRWAEGGTFLLLQAEVPNSDFPTSTALMGPDDSAGTYCMLYFDSRGVSRIYQMSLREGVWKLWREFPGFSQRFTATFREDLSILDGVWEMSTDGTNWEHDFNIKYSKIDQA
jgi:hypothetical protein